MCINRRLNQSFDIWWADKKVVKENVSIIGRTFDQITKLEPRWSLSNDFGTNSVKRQIDDFHLNFYADSSLFEAWKSSPLAGLEPVIGMPSFAINGVDP